MASKDELKQVLRNNLKQTIEATNRALRGEGLDQLEPVLTRIGRGTQLPHWYTDLKSNQALPNLDGKTIGSVIEMLLVAVFETTIFCGYPNLSLRINPARGVDLPDLDLGIKSPSKNFCTSEPFFSAYERLLGGEFDSLVVLTDYQEAKKSPPLKLQLTDYRFLTGSQLADRVLCEIARNHRAALREENEAWLIKFFRFLAFVNQSDWRAKQILRIIAKLDKPDEIKKLIEGAAISFEKVNATLEKAGGLPLPVEDLQAVIKILQVQPMMLGVIDAADNWVTETQKDAARAPNENELARLKAGPLDGQIGMSFALQWRYNFSRLFRHIATSDEEDGQILAIEELDENGPG